MKQPTLLVMAAGLGSRYGGLKQIDPVSSEGEIIMDFSLYDAMMAGFERVVFVIREEMERDFRVRIERGAGHYLRTDFAVQRLDDLPDGYEVPAGREKPWGTCHAVLAARHLIDGPFAVINADDYYGPGAFQVLYDFLTEPHEGGRRAYAMVGFSLGKTLTENGTVARGICEVGPDGCLRRVTERTKIMRRGEHAAYTEDDGATWTDLPDDSVVSMNTWAFQPEMMDEAWKRFPAFLDRALAENPLKGEYFLPDVVQAQIDEGTADVRVLRSFDRWYGVTYQEDKETVVAALQSKKDRGLYPEKLWYTPDPDRIIWK